QSWHVNTGAASTSVDLSLPPSAAFLKVFLADAWFIDGMTPWLPNWRRASASINKVRFRNSSGVDQTIDYSFGAQQRVHYNPTMTGATIVASAVNGMATIVWTLGYWA
ncbi:MAG: hypothetical protein ACRCSN_01510, partial [Dermatophilaceae bacterium]